MTSNYRNGKPKMTETSDSVSIFLATTLTSPFFLTGEKQSASGLTVVNRKNQS